MGVECLRFHCKQEKDLLDGRSFSFTTLVPPLKYMSQHDDVVLDPSEHLPEDIFEDILVYICTDQDVNNNFIGTHPATILCSVSKVWYRFAMGRRCWPILGINMFHKLQEEHTPTEFMRKDIRAFYFFKLPYNVFNNKEWAKSLCGKDARVTSVCTQGNACLIQLLDVAHSSTLRWMRKVQIDTFTDDTLSKCLHKCHSIRSLTLSNYNVTSDRVMSALHSLKCLRKLKLLRPRAKDTNPDELCSAIPYVEHLYLHDVYFSKDIWVSLYTFTSLKHLFVWHIDVPMTLKSCSTLPPNLITMKVNPVGQELITKSIEYHKHPIIGFRRYPFSQSELVEYPVDTILGAVGKSCPNIMVISIHNTINMACEFCRVDSSEYYNVTEQHYLS